MNFLISTLVVIFIINSIFVIFLVLIQSGKGGSMNLMGAASQTPFGASSADILTKTTRIAASSFIALALILSLIFAKREDKMIEPIAPQGQGTLSPDNTVPPIKSTSTATTTATPETTPTKTTTEPAKK